MLYNFRQECNHLEYKATSNISNDNSSVILEIYMVAGIKRTSVFFKEARATQALDSRKSPANTANCDITKKALLSI